MILSGALLSIFDHLFASVADEMGVVLGRAAYSINIKERLDFSCALFLGDGRLLAQAAHIPVHLGAMPASVEAAIKYTAPFSPGDVVILNDPYQGGNHLPDITMVTPLFLDSGGGYPDFFLASRAHHADVGGMSPGSMPLSTELFQEGLIIPPIKLFAQGKKNEAVWAMILRNVRTPVERDGDLAAQLAAHQTGEARLRELAERYGKAYLLQQAEELIQYGDRLLKGAIEQIPNGVYQFIDYLDDDGQTEELVPIALQLTVEEDRLRFDFSGSAAAVAGNLNAVPGITMAAVLYAVRSVALSLLQMEIPMNQGMLHRCEISLPPGSLLDPEPPHAVAAGNVETSQRVVDVVYGALAKALPELIPAASQGTMNNVAFGGIDPVSRKPFVYYETIGGGAGAGSTGPGGSGIHTHMSNTLNSPVEALEHQYPVRILSYRLRSGSGGKGKYQGGDGVSKEIQFLTKVQLTVMSDRRIRPPYGLAGGQPGRTGENGRWVSGHYEKLPGKIQLEMKAGEIIQIKTPGGGGWGKPDEQNQID